ncbi:Arylsulfatase precursor [Anaerohalosphaera lusitana]|uniref:Arylsulfatase n=1 Tax=Anaerohalosphaera lusitana TaxID=1936003 RepID=A0A1U9NP06_9BACT|nr:sulfatase [Anaerohalosphaera lusitana]AQT69682.1 Arylsulfatase precursor [Anaerohalosphaera lusitana]
MDRRAFLKVSGAAALGVGALRGVSFGAERKAAGPNVVMIYLDDSGYGDYEHNGNPTIKTPNIRRMVQEGVSFSQFYVTSPACSASRFSLLTGRYPGRSGLGRWVVGPGSKMHIHPKEVTLADGLKSKGYTTGIFGKWHLGNPNGRNGMTRDALPLAHGFDEWMGTNVSHDYGNAKLMESDASGEDPVKGYRTLARNLPSNTEVCDSLTKRTTEGALRFIEKNSSRPFFAYVAYNMPHLGIHASDEFKGKSRRGLLGDVMMEIDDGVGRIREMLEKAGVSENTLVVFASDNGPWVKFRDTKDHPRYGEARMHVGYAYPFRDGKGSTWEGGHRVPGIFCWPGKIPGNRIVQEPASTLDVLPTVFAMAGVEVPEDRTIDGRDIRGLLMPGEYAWEEGPFTFYYNYWDNKPSAIRKGAWKLHIRIGSQTGNNYGFSASREKPLLFNVEEDLGERIDRAAERPELVKEMLGELEAFEKQLKQEGSFWD